MVVFSKARVRAPMEMKKEKLALLRDMIKRGSTETKEPEKPNEEEEGQLAEEEKEFDNNMDSDEEPASPTSRSPVVQPARVEGAELQLEHATRGFHGFGGLRHSALLVCCTTPAGELFQFAATAMANGGTAFVHIYLLLLALVGVPFSLLELAVGQYTSLPAVSVFERIAPAASGVGLLMLIVRLIGSLFLAIQPRYLLFFYSFVYTSLTGDASWLQCDAYPEWPCSDVVCDEGKVYYNRSCVSEKLIESLPRYAIVDLLAHSEPVVTFTPAHIFHLELTENRDVALILSCMAMLVISGIVAYKGNRFFGNIAPILSATPLVGFVMVISYCLFKVIQAGNFSHVLDGMTPQWKELGEVDTWLHAALAVVYTAGLGDGTLLTLGAQADFNNNLIHDVTIMTAAGALLRILATICLIFLMAASRLGVSLPVEKLFALETDEAVSYWISLPFTVLPSLSYQSGVHEFISTVFYLSMVASLIGFQVVTIEMCLSSLYRTFSQLLQLPDRLTRYSLVSLIISLMCLLMGIVFQFEFATSDQYIYQMIYVEIFAVLVLYELCTILCTYGASRLIVNLETMSGKHYSNQRIAWGSRITWFTWVFILPAFVLAMVITSGIHHKYLQLSASALGVSLMAVVPLIVMTHKVVSSLAEGQRVFPLFQPHPKWGPMNIQNRRRAVRDEMANRIFLY